MMEKAIKLLESLGVGPFPPFLGGQGMTFTEKTVHGKSSEYDMDLRLARGDFGGLSFELIQPLKGNSIYDDFLKEKGEGFHHLAFMVEDVDAEKAELEKRGFKTIILNISLKRKQSLALDKRRRFIKLFLIDIHESHLIFSTGFDEILSQYDSHFPCSQHKIIAHHSSLIHLDVISHHHA